MIKEIVCSHCIPKMLVRVDCGEEEYPEKLYLAMAKHDWDKHQTRHWTNDKAGDEFRKKFMKAKTEDLILEIVPFK